MAGWNVLATSLEGQRDTLLGLLRRFGRFRGAGYRNGYRRGRLRTAEGAIRGDEE